MHECASTCICITLYTTIQCTCTRTFSTCIVYTHHTVHYYTLLMYTYIQYCTFSTCIVYTHHTVHYYTLLMYTYIQYCTFSTCIYMYVCVYASHCTLPYIADIHVYMYIHVPLVDVYTCMNVFRRI